MSENELCLDLSGHCQQRVPSSRKNGDSESPKQRQTFSCKRCSYKTDRKNNLKRHIIAMHETTSQKLECCGLRFPSKADLKNHNAKYHTDGYKCQICGQHFVRKALLERHFSVHTGEKKFACECGYRTSHKSNLERHYKTHFKDGFLQKEQVEEDMSQNGCRNVVYASFRQGFSNCFTSSAECLLPEATRRRFCYCQSQRDKRQINDGDIYRRYEEIPDHNREVHSPKKSKRGFTVEELLREDDTAAEVEDTKTCHCESNRDIEDNLQLPTESCHRTDLDSREILQDPNRIDEVVFQTEKKSSLMVIERPQPTHHLSTIGAQWSRGIYPSDFTGPIFRPRTAKVLKCSSFASAFQPVNPGIQKSSNGIASTSSHLPTSRESQCTAVTQAISSCSFASTESAPGTASFRNTSRNAFPTPPIISSCTLSPNIPLVSSSSSLHPHIVVNTSSGTLPRAIPFPNKAFCSTTSSSAMVNSSLCSRSPTSLTVKTYRQPSLTFPLVKASQRTLYPLSLSLGVRHTLSPPSTGVRRTVSPSSLVVTCPVSPPSLVVTRTVSPPSLVVTRTVSPPSLVVRRTISPTLLVMEASSSFPNCSHNSSTNIPPVKSPQCSLSMSGRKKLPNVAVSECRINDIHEEENRSENGVENEKAKFENTNLNIFHRSANENESSLLDVGYVPKKWRQKKK